MSLTTLTIIVEWKTDRDSVYSSTMKGMKERIALAATLKAKVCTSLSSR